MPGRSRASIGAFGQKSNKRNPYEIKERVRGSSKRVRGALAEARENEAALAARMAAEEAATAHLPVPVFTKPVQQPELRVERRAFTRPSADPEPDPAKRAQWALGDARQLVRDGYSVRQAIRMTGYPRAMLED